MFLVNDTLESRQKTIASYEPFVGVILAAIDFEWTVRRAILALGSSTTKEIKSKTLNANCSGLDAYKKAWNKEVKPLTGKRLDEIVPEWQYFKETAYPLRHRLVHGVEGSVTPQYASDRMKAILSASKYIADFADSLGEPLYGRKIIRRKPRKQLNSAK
ncbi:MAG: hypothetical protein GX633_10585 [Clostridiales bacterium]|jgi:hypothetical protein|nr:hypothetical protein [Clostridiales bacterium]